MAVEMRLAWMQRQDADGKPIGEPFARVLYGRDTALAPVLHIRQILDFELVGHEAWPTLEASLARRFPLPPPNERTPHDPKR